LREGVSQSMNAGELVIRHTRRQRAHGDPAQYGPRTMGAAIQRCPWRRFAGLTVAAGV
jgi:hypothetical protein